MRGSRRDLVWRFHLGPPPTTEPGSKVMNRREFLQAGAASSGLVLSGAGDPRLGRGIHRAGGEASRTDRHGLVWQDRPAQAPPGGPRRGRLPVRRRQEDAGRGRRNRRDAPGLEEETADLRRLPRDAQGEGPRYRPDRHARPLAPPGDDRRRGGRGRCLRREADQRGRDRGPGHAGRGAQASSGSSRWAPSAGARPT